MKTLISTAVLAAAFFCVASVANSTTISGTISGTVGPNGPNADTTDTYGLFGLPGANLYGDSFSESYSYNTADFAGATLNCGTNCTYKNSTTTPLSAYISVTINGHTQAYSPTFYSQVEFQNAYSGYNANFSA